MTPRRPLIAVVAYHLGGDRVARWPQGGYGVPAPYLDALRRAGARTAIVSPGESGEPDELLEPFDGLMLVGGGDVDPSRYGESPGEHVYGVEPDRDAFEIDLLMAADNEGLPTLCICRGMQVLNVAFDGTLHQHLPDMEGLLEHGVPVEKSETVHEVAVETESRLGAAVGQATIACPSHHHQGVDRIGDGLRITGRSADGLVEALERRSQEDGRSSWIVGVQWHPEESAAEDTAQQGLFDSLVAQASQRI